MGMCSALFGGDVFPPSSIRANQKVAFVMLSPIALSSTQACTHRRDPCGWPGQAEAPTQAKVLRMHGHKPSTSPAPPRGHQMEMCQTASSVLVHGHSRPHRDQKKQVALEPFTRQVRMCSQGQCTTSGDSTTQPPGPGGAISNLPVLGRTQKRETLFALAI